LILDTNNAIETKRKRTLPADVIDKMTLIMSLLLIEDIIVISNPRAVTDKIQQANISNNTDSNIDIFVVLYFSNSNAETPIITNKTRTRNVVNNSIADIKRKKIITREPIQLNLKYKSAVREICTNAPSLSTSFSIL
jgi:hypothetical protein